MTGLYPGDSFFTLGPLGQAGLAALSLCLASGLVLLVYRAALRIPGRLRFSWLARVLLVSGAFWLFVWLSPQIYYLYYQTIFEDLPWQIVVRSPAEAAEALGALITFSGRASLSDHGKGLLFWGLAIACLVATWRGRPE